MKEKSSFFWAIISATFVLAACSASGDNIPNSQPKADNPAPQNNNHTDAFSDAASDSVIDEEFQIDNKFYDDTLTDCLFYSAFGAVGDGKTNDMAAIVATHQAANLARRCVKADKGATYYISAISESAIIQTSTDWRGASFIIDDSQITTDNRSNHIFAVISAMPSYFLIAGGQKLVDSLPINSIARQQKNIGFVLPQDAVIALFDTTTKRYIREGQNANKGASQTDFILVDKDGNVADTSPIIWDYNIVTDLQVFPVDSEPLYLVGGTFTTIANQAASLVDVYYNRGINIMRSNVVVDGFTHYIEGELNHGCPYNGILTMNYAANITVKNSIFTGHKLYMSGATQLGSYDIQPTGVINLTLENLKQTNDIMDKNFWGVMGSNYCKNIILKNCELSRFDAHQGVAGVTILNSKLGHQGMLVIGEGDLIMKNTTVYGSLYTGFITLRDDYGSTWRGNLYIENCSWEPPKGLSIMPVIFASNSGNHNFGYECYLPETITINGLYINKTSTTYLLPDTIPDNNTAAYPYHIPREISIKDLKTTSTAGWELYQPQSGYKYSGMEIHQEN